MSCDVQYLTDALPDVLIGIGRSTARKFAENGVKQLALGDIDVESLKHVGSELVSIYPDLNVMLLPLDVSSEQAVNDAIRQTIDRFGSLDIAVNNAGVSGPSRPTTDVKFEDWKNLFDINLHGVWLCERAEIQQMLKQA